MTLLSVLRTTCGLAKINSLAPGSVIWHLLNDPSTDFVDLGPNFYDNRLGTERRKRDHVRQLEGLGYHVTLKPAA